MTVLLVVFMLLAFVGIDFIVRKSTGRLHAKREREAREAILNVSVRLEFNDEAKSLKRVEVPNPKARILAVDDEAVVLDSFRRILVLEGFNIDTVQSGPEALSLVRRNDYDFVFTDLKMPDMDGVEVVKAVKHLRPDVDMVVITGYGTIETAVETMQHGASEYVQKPFSADELAEFVNKLLVKRQARVAALRQPTVRIVSPARPKPPPPMNTAFPAGPSSPLATPGCGSSRTARFASASTISPARPWAASAPWSCPSPERKSAAANRCSPSSGARKWSSCSPR